MFNFPIELEINDIRVKSPKIGGIKRKPEKIWSTNTGRAASAKMQGTIIAIKQTFSIEWGPMTPDEQALIESLISDVSTPYSTLRVRRPDGTMWEVECYFGTPTFQEWEWCNGQWMCPSVTVDAIER